MNIQSISSSTTYRWTYDVFLSFRGEDTRMGFTGNLFHALDEKGIHTFIDNRLERGREITPALFKAIEESRIAIVIFSENYASSTFCLEELVKILESIKQQGRLVWPVFYQVDPSDVRHLRKSYGVAISKHEENFHNNKEKVRKWKLALQEAANLSGWHFKHRYDYEYKFIRNIVEEVLKKISRVPLHVAEYPIGLESRARKVISLLNLESSEEVIMAGIYGIGGIGKSTIARAVYNAIVDQFEGACFLFNIRENSIKHGLTQLQETLINEIIGENETRVRDVNIGIPLIRRKLNQKKVLLILDDINKQEQLKALAGTLDWFSSGSRIIIITRDERVLDIHNVERKYEVEKLNLNEALELFNWNAFGRIEGDQQYANLSNQVAYYCNGLALALEIIGSNLFGKSAREWESALEIYGGMPDDNVQKTLAVSYNDLNETEKEVFLDVACFFTGYRLQDVTNILSKSYGFNPQYVIGNLKKKSLLKFDGYTVTMHNLIQHMGREIVRRQSPLNPGNRSRLWYYKDILRVLEDNLGSDSIESLVLHLPPDKEVQWDGTALEKMRNLKILIIGNVKFSCEPKHLPNSLRVLEWKEYPSPSLPAGFRPRNLGILNLHGSCIKLITPFKNFESLNVMVLRDCRFLEQVPDVSAATNLREIYVDGCENLVEVHNSVGFLSHLCLLNARGCTELRIFPKDIYSTSFESLNLSGCSRLENFPKMSGIMKDTTYVKYGNLEDKAEDSSRCLEPLTLVLEQFCGNISLKCGFDMLQKLENWGDASQRYAKNTGGDEEVSPKISSFIEFCGCNLETLDFLFQWFPLFRNLISLNLAHNEFTILPACINECRYLNSLILDGCNRLAEIRGIPQSLKTLSAIGCTSLTTESKSIILNQTLHESGGTKFTLPGPSVPRWLDYRIEGKQLSFWFRNNFPTIALCIVHKYSADQIFIRINGISVFDMLLKADRIPHISLFDLVSRHGWPGRWIASKMDEWNYVTVSCNNASWMGVHVCNKEEIKTNGDDVRISYTYPPDVHRVTCEEMSMCILRMDYHKWMEDRYTYDTCNMGSYSLLGPPCPFLDIEICEAIQHTQARTKVERLMKNIEGQSLSTCDDLFRRKLVNSPYCPICRTEIETIEHVFLLCPWTRPLWFASDFPWAYDPEYDTWEFYNWVEQRFQRKYQYPNAKIRFALFSNICWAIWKGRNDFIVRNKPVNPWEALMTAKSMLTDYLSSHDGGSSSGTIHLLRSMKKFLDLSIYGNLGEDSASVLCGKGKRIEGHNDCSVEWESANDEDWPEGQYLASGNQQNAETTESENKYKAKRKTTSNDRARAESTNNQENKSHQIHHLKKRKKDAIYCQPSDCLLQTRAPSPSIRREVERETER